MACCLVEGLGLGLDLVSGCLEVMHTYSVVIVTLPIKLFSNSLSCRLNVLFTGGPADDSAGACSVSTGIILLDVHGR